jgi:hypothetical protein
MQRATDAEFENNVFINCPFDGSYVRLLRPLLFVVTFLGFCPKIASERSDSFESRIHKIRELILSSKFSIHDLSLLQAAEKNELYRMNMPFELGIDYGCQAFSKGRQAEKKCLIIAKAKYDYVKALSDLSGVDIKSHGGKPVQLVRAVRDWFVETVELPAVPGATSIWLQFNGFMSDFYNQRKQEGFSTKDLSFMPVPEFIGFIRQWVRTERERHGGGAP